MDGNLVVFISDAYSDNTARDFFLIEAEVFTAHKRSHVLDHIFFSDKL